MNGQALRSWWWTVLFTGSLVILTGAGWTLSRLTANPEGSLNIMYSRVRVGMSLDEAITAVSDHADCMYINGKTKSGRSFDSLVVASRDLPIPSEVQHGELSVEAGDGGEVDIFLGPGGIVAGKSFNPESSVELWLHRLHQVFGH